MKRIVLIILLFSFYYKSIAQTQKGFDLINSSIPVEEILNGGPERDGIPSIDSPIFISSQQSSLENDERIMGVYHNGIAKAFPIKILNYHEIVNDWFGENPVVITYCPLCGSGIAFDANIEGKTRIFGVSGLLYNSDVLLYDRETESLWSQLKYGSISGPMAGTELQPLLTTNTTWGNWKAKYPNSLILSEETGFSRDYSKNPYPQYDKSEQLYFPVKATNDKYHPKELIMGLEINGKYKAYPFSELSRASSKSITDTFQGNELKISYDKNSISAEIFDQTGTQLNGVTTFWFAWFAFHPETEVFEAKR